MQTVANCADLVEAQQVRMLLESVGIAVFIPDEMTASAVSPIFMNSSGIRVQVEDEDYADALRVLEEHRPGQTSE